MSLRQITPAIRVIEADREWIIQTPEMRRSRRHGAQPTGEWVDRSYITNRSMLNMELKRLVGKGAAQAGLRGHVEQDVLDWLNGLPARHPSRGEVKPLVIDILEAQGTGLHTTGELRDDIPLIVQHGPLKYRDRWNARYDV
ncbi:hypothetical protein BQ8794_280050 [Mesorhizobium prunaredense]|uniref:Uncharacterized protein n=1 Tax=Mesorhizobium prunaredense TaxID=1631249 RepID=A0A1R3VC06_9HYPH|nr:hypothetical protein [Mesorhizobium prunaredense]SIT56311.1 hypothetical protein BQ8794_280050 [Mesorhizobium prunaredense]